jgi:RHS repeat-associated protein
VSTLEGSIALTTSGTGGVELQLIDLHGDVVGTLAVPDPAGEAPITSIELRAADEFGNAIALPGTTEVVKGRYSWLGASQRSAETLGDVVLMGVRLYSPVTGRFLSVDPVDGGSASAYDYCSADPVNCTDLGGTWGFKSIMKVVAEVASVASVIPGPIGMVAAGVSAVAYAVTGDWANAALMTAGIAASAVGAGAAVVAIKAAKTTVKVGTMVAKAAPKAELAFNAAKTVASKVRPALNAGKAAVKRVLGGCNSFEAGTLVLLADGTQIPIEDVAAGDVVMATDPVTGVTGPEPVTDLIRHLEDHAWVSVTVVSGTGAEVLEATEEHPFFVTSTPTAAGSGQGAIAGGWVNAADLVVGDVVRTADGGTAVVAGVTVAPVTAGTLDWAFNLTVADAHTS